MIRVVIFFVVVGALALGGAWLAERPGEVAITWLSWRIETSVMVLAVAIMIAATFAMILLSLLRGILRSPEAVSQILRERRGVKGYLAVSRGLIAVGSGDVRAARKFAGEARRIAPAEPLSLLLSAQTSQLAGDHAEAERAFRDMASRPDTKALGLHGLYVEAQRRDDVVAARAYAEEAAKATPSAGWAGRAALEFRCAAGDWAGARAALESNLKGGVVDKKTSRRQRAVLLTAQAQAAEESDRDSAKALAIEAAKLAPTLVPAVAMAARLLAEGGEVRKASRMIERAWLAEPHPDLADTYAHLRIGDSARDRLARVKTLAQKAPRHIESALAIARVALDANEFTQARDALAPLAAAPTQRVAVLMAELEEKERGEEGRAREWMARALNARSDPAWTADGFVSDRWLAVSPVSGRIDVFQWKVPLAQLAAAGPVIEPAAELTAHDMAVIDAAPEAPAAGAHEHRDEKILAGAGSASPVSGRKARRREAVPAKAEAVIPLVHAPDDPGPEPAPAPPPDPWRRLRQLFK